MYRLRIILIALLILAVNTKIVAQALKLDELEKFNQLSMDSFKNEIKKLNYKYYDKTESSEFVLYEYDSSDYQYKIGKFQYTTDKSSDRIEFQFKAKNEYNQYLKTIAGLGYKQTETGKIPGGETYVDYFKNKDHIRLISPKTGEPNDPYTILIFKKL